MRRPRGSTGLLSRVFSPPPQARPWGVPRMPAEKEAYKADTSRQPPWSRLPGTASEGQKPGALPSFVLAGQCPWTAPSASPLRGLGFRVLISGQGTVPTPAGPCCPSVEPWSVQVSGPGGRNASGLPISGGFSLGVPRRQLPANFRHLIPLDQELSLKTPTSL